MSPIDYSTDVQSPFQAALQGYQSGAVIRQDQAQQQQQAVQLQAAQAQQKALQAFIKNPNRTAEDYSNAILALPGYREQLDASWKTLNSAQQQSLLDTTSQVYAALNSGKPEIAAGILNKQADAIEASGGSQRDIQANRDLARVALTDKDFAKAKAFAMLSALPGGDKFIANITALNKAPADQRKAEADATTAEVAAGNAPTKAGLDNEKAAQEIKTAEAQRKVADLNVQIAQANSETQRGQLILERDKWQAEVDKAKGSQGQGAQDKIDTISQTLDTVKSVLNHPGLSKGTGAGGDFMAWFNGSDAADFRAQVDTLKSQQFLSSVAGMKGTGALSDAEGARLERAIASLDTRQSPGQFKTALGVIKATLGKAQAKLIASGQAPTKGGAFVIKSPTYGNVTEGDINRLLTQYPGSTREQVLQFLQSQKNSGGATGAY